MHISTRIDWETIICRALDPVGETQGSFVLEIIICEWKLDIHETVKGQEAAVTELQWMKTKGIWQILLAHSRQEG